jgi:hypothetical protein
MYRYASTTKTTQRNPSPALAMLARLMDSQFRLPGTGIRFGLDAILGVIPGAGDFVTFLVSGGMLLVLARNGASGYVLARMVLNVLLDAAVGSIPVVGDLFDIFFKANQRNLRLMHEHYVEGRHRGGAWKVIVPVLILLLGCVALIGWLAYSIVVWLADLFANDQSSPLMSVL